MKIVCLPLSMAIMLLSSCIRAPVYPIEPNIEFKSVSDSRSIIYIDQNGNAIYVPDTLTISFTDGDGDIATFDNPADTALCVDPCSYADGDTSCLSISSKNIFLIDSRDTCIATYSSANIEPQGKFDGISGEILILHTIYMKGSACFTPSPACPKETVRFKIRIKDTAGHLSNEVETSPITVEVLSL